MHLARYWTTKEKVIQCQLCPHACRIADQDVGRCGVRRVRHGRLFAEAYGLISAISLDPIEKKPLFHVKPGREILSIGSAGCNFRCMFCQNWTISQEMPPLKPLSPEQCLQETKRHQACGVAYTYNEPLINLEYVADCAREVKTEGLLNVVVSNGYINPEPLRELLPLIDAWNIDIKSMDRQFYEKRCEGSLAPVLKTVETVAAHSHVEITHLLVEQGEKAWSQIERLIDWVAGLSPDIPVHFTRYFPNYRWEAPPTDPAFMRRVWERAKEKLTWVYLGNVGFGKDSIVCPHCQEVCVERRGYQTYAVNLQDGKCPQCGQGVKGIF